MAIEQDNSASSAHNYNGYVGIPVAFDVILLMSIIQSALPCLCENCIIISYCYNQI